MSEKGAFQYIVRGHEAYDSWIVLLLAKNASKLLLFFRRMDDVS